MLIVIPRLASPQPFSLLNCNWPPWVPASAPLFPEIKAGYDKAATSIMMSAMTATAKKMPPDGSRQRERSASASASSSSSRIGVTQSQPDSIVSAAQAAGPNQPQAMFGVLNAGLQKRRAAGRRIACALARERPA
jgi:hypothetical protein